MSEKYILIVEDEKPISDILKFNLEKEGYKVQQAFDGEDGLNSAKNTDFDLILLDVMLPRFISATDRVDFLSLFQTAFKVRFLSCTSVLSWKGL